MNGDQAVPSPQQTQTTEDGKPGARRRFRLQEGTLRPDRGPCAAPVTFTMHCAKCGAHGPEATDGWVGTAWAAKHLKAHPSHVGYSERVTRPYRFEPGAWL